MAIGARKGIANDTKKIPIAIFLYFATKFFSSHTSFAFVSVIACRMFGYQRACSYLSSSFLRRVRFVSSQLAFVFVGDMGTSYLLFYNPSKKHRTILFYEIYLEVSVFSLGL